VIYDTVVMSVRFLQFIRAGNQIAVHTHELGDQNIEKFLHPLPTIVQVEIDPVVKSRLANCFVKEDAREECLLFINYTSRPGDEVETRVVDCKIFETIFGSMQLQIVKAELWNPASAQSEGVFLEYFWLVNGHKPLQVLRI
jgi:chromosome condensin MukBEF complex kleisin-like MukF subunit